jgi:hypothetical protein
MFCFQAELEHLTDEFELEWLSFYPEKFNLN